MTETCLCDSYNTSEFIAVNRFWIINFFFKSYLFMQKIQQIDKIGYDRLLIDLPGKKFAA